MDLTGLDESRLVPTVARAPRCHPPCGTVGRFAHLHPLCKMLPQLAASAALTTERLLRLRERSIQRLDRLQGRSTYHPTFRLAGDEPTVLSAQWGGGALRRPACIPQANTSQLLRHWRSQRCSVPTSTFVECLGMREWPGAGTLWELRRQRAFLLAGDHVVRRADRGLPRIDANGRQDRH